MTAALTVTRFKTPDGAESMLEAIKDMQTRSLITLIDAAIVTWPQGKSKPRTRQLYNLTGAGAVNGAFWGMLFGILFFVPLLGVAVGAAMGALSGSMADIGIDDDFIRRVRGEVTEGTSALFLLTTNAVEDRVINELKRFDFELIASNLSQDEEDRLKTAFGEEA